MGRDEIHFPNWVVVRVNLIPSNTSDHTERMPARVCDRLENGVDSQRKTQELRGLSQTAIVCDLNSVSSHQTSLGVPGEV